MEHSEQVEPFPARPQVLSIEELRKAYRRGTTTPGRVIRELLTQLARLNRPEVWTWLRPMTELLTEADRLDAILTVNGEQVLERHPLFGIPFAVKDNIDIAGLPTTAACPAFAYVSAQSAVAVQRLLEAQAVLIGKTNLDQFATGLVGTRSPFGIVRNAIDPRYISGGSSSGSAVAVALGLCAFALGTDTAGSGRVPAGFNGIVGLKPSRGLVSTSGVTPACRSLDCVSIFAGTVGDAWHVLNVIAGPDPGDSYSRSVPQLAPRPRKLRVGRPAQPEFYGDGAAALAWRRSLDFLASSSVIELAEVDITPLLGAAELLYQGPWVAERRAAIGAFFDSHREAIDAEVAAAISPADQYSAVDAFKAEYRLAEYRQLALRMFQTMDVLLVPTAPDHPTIAEVQAQPAVRNRQLGYYTNFVNLLDLSALAIPGIPRADGLPFGLTLIGPSGADQRLAVLGAAIGELLGNEPAQSAHRLARSPLPVAAPTIDVAVVGAHLDGQPLNWQLIECGARLGKSTETAPRYRLYALPDTQPAKPGLSRVAEGGSAIAVEVWSMPQAAFGAFISQVGPPLGIGSIELADGQWVKGFICEPYALARAEDISAFGGWRAYLSARSRTTSGAHGAPETRSVS